MLSQRTDVMNKVENFRNKTFFIAHGTADGASNCDLFINPLVPELCYDLSSKYM